MAPLPAHHPSPEQAPARTGGLRRAVRRFLMLFLAAAVSAGLITPIPAQAAPTVEEIEAQIDKEWEKLEPTIEQYNKVRSQLKKNQAKEKELEKKIQPLELQTQLALNEIGSLASHYYKTGPSQELNALLASGNSSELAEQLTILDVLAGRKQKQISAVVAIRDKYNAQKKKLDALIAAQAKQQRELAARKAGIDAEIKRLKALLPKTTVMVAGCPTINGVVSEKARIAIKTACAQVGDPYVWGATGPSSFDCSGLTQYAWKAAGVYLTHFTGAQWNEGTPVSRAEARPGDLVFFYSDLHHVGLYLGNGLMVHAPRTGKPVQTAKISYMPVAGFRRVG